MHAWPTKLRPLAGVPLVVEGTGFVIQLRKHIVSSNLTASSILKMNSSVAELAYAAVTFSDLLVRELTRAASV